MRVQYEFTTLLSPEAVVAALTDFSERRPQIWPNLDPAKYEVHELGDRSALATEGSRSPALWARERYDWSIPGRVSWRAEESNFCAPGSGIVVSVARDPSGGSRVAIDWDRTPTSAIGYLVAFMVRMGKDRVLGFKAALDRLVEGRDESLPLAA